MNNSRQTFLEDAKFIKSFSDRLTHEEIEKLMWLAFQREEKYAALGNSANDAFILALACAKEIVYSEKRKIFEQAERNQEEISEVYLSVMVSRILKAFDELEQFK